MLPSPPKHQGFVTRKLQAQLKPVAAAQASDDATSVEALVVREEVSTKLFDPSPPRRRNDNNSSGGGGASTSGTSPLVDITNKRLTENRVKLAVHSMTTQDAPHDTTLHVTPIKQSAWFPSEQSPVDGCTLVMLSSVPRLLMTSSPEACFKAPAVTERAAASTAATVVRGSNAASVSPVPCRTLPRRNVEPAVTAVVVSAGINTTPRRGLVVNDNDVSANSASVTRWESPSLLKQRHMRQLVQGALFDHGVVGSVSPQRLALLMSEGRSPNPGEVVMFDGVAAVVGDPSKIRFTPKPPPRPLLV